LFNLIRCLQTLSICLLLTPVLSQAQNPRFFDFDYPKGWAVDTEKNGSSTAYPLPLTYERSVSVLYCNFLSQSECKSGCDKTDLRSRWLMTLTQPNAQYIERKRTDGYIELHESSNYGDARSWIANTVLCGESGIVVVGATSETSRKEAVALIDAVLATLKWRKPEVSIKNVLKP
jgi:hypothetical protein